MSDRYAVFGNPIAQSMSPLIHRLFAEQLDQDLTYEARLVEIDKFDQAASAFFVSGGKGLNVTLPFKTQAFQFAHQCTDRAHQAGAVNTLTLDNKGLIQGDNTDGFGLLLDIQDHLGWPIKGKRILVLGAGGAVRGVVKPLLDAEPSRLQIANRTADKAVSLAQAFAQFGPVSGCGLDDLSDDTFDLVINATSASLAGDLLALPGGVIRPTTYCYDMVYAAEPTVFLQRYGADAAATADGLGMLVAQAAESFRIWRGKFPDFVKVIETVRQHMLNKDTHESKKKDD